MSGFIPLMAAKSCLAVATAIFPLHLISSIVVITHKVLIYTEYHSLCPLVGIGTLPPPLSPASVSFPPVPKAGGGGGTLVGG